MRSTDLAAKASVMVPPLRTVNITGDLGVRKTPHLLTLHLSAFWGTFASGFLSLGSP